MSPIKIKSFNKEKNNLQIISAFLQIICSSIMIFCGSLLLFLMAIYGFSNSDISYYTPWLFATTICGVSFAIALIFLVIKLLRSTNTSKSIRINIAIIILNSVFILLWIANVASEYSGYVSLWPFVIYCLPLIPQIVIIVLISLYLKMLTRDSTIR